jgi:hypothetical protein
VVPELAVAAGTAALAFATYWMGRRVRDEGRATVRLAEGAELDRDLANGAVLIGDEDLIRDIAIAASNQIKGGQPDQLVSANCFQLSNLGRGFAKAVAVLVNLQADPKVSRGSLRIACFKAPVVPPGETAVLRFDFASKTVGSSENLRYFSPTSDDDPFVLIFWRDMLGYINRSRCDGSDLQRWRGPRTEPLEGSPEWSEAGLVWDRRR